MVPGLGWLLDRVEPPSRLVDWSLLGTVVLAGATGVVSLGVGHPSQQVVFWLHGVSGLALVVLLAFKLRRVRRRVTERDRWDRATPVSVLTALVAVAALATGVFWAFGGNVPVFVWTTLNVHILFGLLLVPLVGVHLLLRARRPRRVDFGDRRDAIRVGAVLLAGALALRGQELLNRLLDTPGADRRFTGSKPTDGESFPVTSWVADDPDPISSDDWRLRVEGLVDSPFAVSLTDLEPRQTDRALLDCTSGWYTVQDWSGVRIGDLLDLAAVHPDARWVTVHSVTGYRWSIPLAEARDALLATHVAGERLSHGHGFPARLVAPGRRGFQWVKWVESLEVRRRRDPAQWLAVFVSGFD